jgi:hypothetical protein
LFLGASEAKKAAASTVGALFEDIFDLEADSEEDDDNSMPPKKTSLKKAPTPGQKKTPVGNDPDENIHMSFMNINMDFKQPFMIAVYDEKLIQMEKLKSQ